MQKLAESNDLKRFPTKNHGRDENESKKKSRKGKKGKDNTSNELKDEAELSKARGGKTLKEIVRELKNIDIKRKRKNPESGRC